MTESEANVLQAQLRTIITTLAEHTGEFRALGARLTAIEQPVAALVRRFVKLESRIERIEQRLGLGDG